ncbi:hypothetical protein ACOSQ3_029061 [Xanthoceras sorbifolium]
MKLSCHHYQISIGALTTNWLPTEMSHNYLYMILIQPPPPWATTMLGDLRRHIDTRLDTFVITNQLVQAHRQTNTFTNHHHADEYGVFQSFSRL